MLVYEGLELLTEDQCLDLMATEQLGRVGITVGALPAIFPVNYRIDGRDIFFRTGAGTKLRAAADGGVVGFEVDHVETDARAGWSVLVIGIARVVEAADESAVPAVEPSPWAGGDRSHLVHIMPEIISGRRLVTL